MASESHLKLYFILLYNLLIWSTLYTQYNYNKTIFCLIIILTNSGLMFIISWGKRWYFIHAENLAQLLKVTEGVWHVDIHKGNSFAFKVANFQADKALLIALFIRNKSKAAYGLFFYYRGNWINVSSSCLTNVFCNQLCQMEGFQNFRFL